MEPSNSISNTVNKVKSETASRYISGILATATIGLFAYFVTHKMEALAYVSISVSTVASLFFARFIIKQWLYQMIDKRANELIIEKVKEVRDLTNRYQQEQYKINCEYSDLMTKNSFRASQEDVDMKKRIEREMEEKFMPMNIAISLLVQNLSSTIYNDDKMKARTHLDDFNDNFKNTIIKMNLPGKDNQYKEQLMNSYFQIINSFSVN